MKYECRACNTCHSEEYIIVLTKDKLVVGLTDLCDYCKSKFELNSCGEIVMLESPKKTKDKLCCLNCDSFQTKLWFNKTLQGKPSNGYCKLYAPYFCLEGNEKCDKHSPKK